MSQAFSFGQWFRVVTGLVEIAAAIALLMPGFAAFGAAWLAVTMVLATLTHLAVLHTDPAPALVLFAGNLVVAWLHREQLSCCARLCSARKNVVGFISMRCRS